MRFIIRSSLLGLLLLAAAVTLVACGEEETRTREAMPFMRIRLKNTSAPSQRPASAVAVGTNPTGPGQTNSVGPVAPGEDKTSEPDGTEAAEAVTVTVTFDDGPAYSGSGSYPGSRISHVDIECAEEGGGKAMVNFATGQPAEKIPLRP